jgi:hypothetical protein
MQYVRRIEPEKSGMVGFGVRTLLIGGLADCESLTAQISGLGASIEVETDFFRAVELICQDPAAFNICMLDCDSFGGLAAGQRFVRFLGESMTYVPVILLSREVKTQYFSEHSREPTVLRLPLSPVAARVGFEHSLRERFVLRAS